MKLTIFNGSPRGPKSNTKILLEHFLRGYLETPGNSFEIHYLNRIHEAGAFKQAFGKAEAVLLAFPLYTDAMPGIVKAFLETLQPFIGRGNNPPLGFVVQSGFMEATHSRHVEKYLVKLAARLGSDYLGTIVKGGVEGIQIQPPAMTRKLYDSFYRIGQVFGRTGRFDDALLHQLAQPERLSWRMIWLLSIMEGLGLRNFYWDSQLKANGAYERRFDRPYSE